MKHIDFASTTSLETEMKKLMKKQDGKSVFLKNWTGKAWKEQSFQSYLAGKVGLLFLRQILLSIPFMADMGNKLLFLLLMGTYND